MAASRTHPPVWKKTLAGAKEISEWAGVEPAMVAHWAKTDWFPKPHDELHMGRVYLFSEVVEALSKRGFPKEPYFERYPAHRKTDTNNTDSAAA